MNTSYDIFARKEHAEPLTYIGSIEAETAAAVAAASLTRFGPESNWLEMIAAPQPQIIIVFSEKQEQPI